MNVLAATLVIAATTQVASGHCRFDLLAESITIAPNKPFWVAARFRIDAKWHIYWLNPGESGLPTHIDWKLPKGFKAAEVRWPAPSRLEVGGIVSYGYEGMAVVLAKILPPPNIKAGTSASIAAKADWMACQTECVMGEGTGRVLLKVASTVKSNAATARLFALARKSVPESGTSLGAYVTGAEGKIRLNFFPPQLEQAQSAHFFPLQPLTIEGGNPQSAVWGKDSWLDLTKATGFTRSENLEGVLVVNYAQNKRRAFIVKAPYKSLE